MRQRCVACRGWFEAPRQRSYCGRPCWPSEPRVEGLVELRDEITKAIERSGPSEIDLIALRRIDALVTRANGRGALRSREKAPQLIAGKAAAHMSSPMATAIHEAAHCVAAYVLGIAVTSSVKPKETHLGITNFNASGFEPSIDCAVVFAAGSMAGRMLAGSPERTNWLNLADPDVSKALWFIDSTPDPLLARRIVELRSRSLLRTRWDSLQALADELDHRVVLLGAQVEELLRGVRRAKDEPRSIDSSTRHAVVDGAPVLDSSGTRSRYGGGRRPWTPWRSISDGH